MAVQNDRAIVIRLVEYSETSQIAGMFAERSGRLRLIAKGIRRSTRSRVSTGLDLLELGELSFAPPRGDATLGTLIEWAQRETFPGLRRSLPGLNCGLYAAEWVAAATEESDPHPRLFRGLTDLLMGLAQTDPHSPAACLPPLVKFQTLLLAEVGFMPNLESCVSCGKTRPPGSAGYFGTTVGGLLCRSCQHRAPRRQRISAAMLDAGPGGADPLQWFELLDAHLAYVVGRPFRMALPLRQALARSRERSQPLSGAEELPGNCPRPEV